MAKKEQKLAEYRAVRDDAHALFRADLELLRENLTPRALAERASDQITELSETTRDAVHQHRGVILGGVAATIAAGSALWLARGPIGNFLGAVKIRLGFTETGGTDQLEKDDTP